MTWSELCTFFFPYCSCVFHYPILFLFSSVSYTYNIPTHGKLHCVRLSGAHNTPNMVRWQNTGHAITVTVWREVMNEEADDGGERNLSRMVNPLPGTPTSFRIFDGNPFWFACTLPYTNNNRTQFVRNGIYKMREKKLYLPACTCIRGTKLNHTYTDTHTRWGT